MDRFVQLLAVYVFDCTVINFESQSSQTLGTMVIKENNGKLKKLPSTQKHRDKHFFFAR